ncbi:DUF6531 domain-containing protein [Xanthomonas pisi]|uniref:RHS repeat protein n=1 Tax=Xanthomonas pisi TaxID=56457 RepID=A0A2S7CUN0_9XANT|nr:DUF6531 domain-containing protein [Xanthomonas pisi]KLD71395.1 hypothetical protein Y887_06750 [Xanthomonas pisi DSM 18956]PPU65307.1 RHS repeat protein [Xanthomonas pisi]
MLRKHWLAYAGVVVVALGFLPETASAAAVYICRSGTSSVSSQVPVWVRDCWWQDVPDSGGNAGVVSSPPTGGGAGGAYVTPPANTAIAGRDAQIKDACDVDQGQVTVGAPATVGNPIVLATGNKIEKEVDFLSGGDMGLQLSRTYNHYWTGAGLFGRQWISNFDYKLSTGTTVDSCYPRPGGGNCGLSGNVLYAWRPDGTTLKFTLNSELGGIYVTSGNRGWPRIAQRSDGKWVLTDENNATEVYSASGYVESVTNPYGIGWTYSYNGTLPTRVTHTSGRYVEFSWNGNQLIAVRDPAGNYYGYAYHANQFGSGLHRLASTSQPGDPATTTVYHYELSARPGALTGKSINGTRYSTFGYDSNGYAVSTQHNGLNKNTLAYTPGANGLLTVVSTNPLGKQATYVFQDGKHKETTGHPALIARRPMPPPATTATATWR